MQFFERRVPQFQPEQQALPWQAKLRETLLVGLCGGSFYLADAHGYVDGATNKIFTGELWPILEGSGHSVGSVAFLYGAFSFLNALNAFQRPMSPSEKALASAAIGVIFELFGLFEASVVDEKDLAAVVITSALLGGIDAALQFRR